MPLRSQGPNKARAAARAASETVSPASIRAISSTRSSGPKGTTVEVVPPSVTRFSTRQWWPPKAATWGECVTTRTCAPLASAARRRPTASAVAPPTPCIGGRAVRGPRARATMAARRDPSLGDDVDPAIRGGDR